MTGRSERAPVRCRLRRGAWFWVVFLLAMGGGWASLFLSRPSAPALTPDLTAILLLTAFSGAFVVAALLLALLIVRAEVFADGNGLRWRGLGRWRRAEWSDVHDYYEPLLRRHSGCALPSVVHTPVGKLHLGDAWTNILAFRSLVRERATLARAREWETRGTRPEDEWPQEFAYPASGARGLRIMAAVSLLLGLGALAEFGRGMVRYASEVGWLFGLLAILIFVSLYSALPLLLATLLLAEAAAVSRRQGERIVATPEGIAFIAQDRQIRAAWHEVTGYRYVYGQRWQDRRCVVETDGGSFDFTHHVRECPLLRRIIERYASQVPEPGWHTSSVDTLGGDASRWSGSQAGLGQRVYHFRTRAHRAALCVPAAMAAACAAIPFLVAAGLQDDQDPGTPAVLAAVLGAATLWGWWRYRAASVRTDDLGITQYAPFGRRHILWPEVQSYRMAGSEGLQFGVVEGAGVRITFWEGIVDADELKAEIARRAVNAQSRGWDP